MQVIATPTIPESSPFSIKEPDPISSINPPPPLAPLLPSHILKFLCVFLPFTIIALALGVAAMAIQIMISNNTIIYQDPNRNTHGGYLISDGLTISNDSEIGLSEIFRESYFGTRSNLSNFPAGVGPLLDTDLLFDTNNIVSAGDPGSFLLYDGSSAAYQLPYLAQVAAVPTDLITPVSGWCSTRASFSSETGVVITTSQVDTIVLSAGDIIVWSFVLSSGPGLRAIGGAADHGEFEVDISSFFPLNTVRVPGSAPLVGTGMLVATPGVLAEPAPITKPTSGFGAAPGAQLTVRFDYDFAGTSEALGIIFSVNGSVRLRVT